MEFHWLFIRRTHIHLWLGSLGIAAYQMIAAAKVHTILSCSSQNWPVGCVAVHKTRDENSPENINYFRVTAWYKSNPLNPTEMCVVYGQKNPDPFLLCKYLSKVFEHWTWKSFWFTLKIYIFLPNKCVIQPLKRHNCLLYNYFWIIIYKALFIQCFATQSASEMSITFTKTINKSI